jgi:hypothetical protein
MMKKKYYLFILFLFGIVACQKTEVSPNTTPTTQTSALLTANTWKLSKINVSGNDITNLVPDLAFKGMQITFNKNYTYQTLPQATTVFTTSNWRLKDDKNLVLNDLPNSVGRATEFNIAKITSTTLELYVDYTPYNNGEDIIYLLFEK